MKTDFAPTPEQIIKNNSALVHSIVKPYQNKGIDTDDLVQEGYIGLLEAYKHFNKSSNAKFSTYAVYWIKKYILKALENNYNTCHMSLSTVSNSQLTDYNNSTKISGKANDYTELKLSTDMPDIEQKVIRLSFEHGLTLKEISSKLGITTERVRQIKQKALRRLKIDHANRGK